MRDCAPMPTPLPMKLDNLHGHDELFAEPSYFRSLAGKLQYLTLTRPDLQFSVNYICQKMHQPSVSDFSLLKRILRYVKGTFDMGVSIKGHTDSTLVCYSDSDWAGCKDTRRSTGGFCTMLGSNVISWSAKRHDTVSKSSTEAEYRTMSAATSEIVWLQNLLKIMGLQQRITPLLLCDNLSAVCLTANPMFHKRTKHFDIDYHYVRERVAGKALEVKHIPATLQIADVFTKSLSQQSFYKWRSKLGVVVPPTPSLRGSKGSMNTGPLFEAHLEERKKTVAVSQPKNKSLSSSATSVNKQALREHGTVKPAHCVETKNRFERLDSCTTVC